MFQTNQYAMVLEYLNILERYLKDPFVVDVEMFDQMLEQTNFEQERLFDDPKLLSFYVWLKSKITKQNLYDLLKDEYDKLK